MKEETKEKLRQINIGKKHSDETKNRMSNSLKGIKNPKFNGYYCTPWEKFTTASNASTNQVSDFMIKTWCNNPDKKVSYHHVAKSIFLSKNDIGRTFKELGFFKTID